MKTQKIPRPVWDIAATMGILCAAFAISLIFQHWFQIDAHITTVFVFAVYLISLLTDGYIYGIVSSIISVLAVNFAFTFPYFAFNFTIPLNLISAVVMIVISVLTGTLTTKVKHHEAEKAEVEREHTRATLLRAVSHDLRTPLTTIYGSVSTLRENSDKLSPAQQDAILQGIQEDSEWLMRMVENLLSITRIDSGQVKISKTPTVLEELIDSVMIQFHKRYPQQEVVLDIPDEIIVIPMDPMLIEQSLLNLLENAVQHASGMTRLVLRVFPLGEKAVFEIRDNGCGIHADRLKRIFSGGSDESLPADSKKQNAGIGLSVCATIVKAHGGCITAENSKEGGAVFRFTLDMEECWSEQQ